MKGSTWVNDYLKLLFQATAIANIADNAASAPLTNLYLSLHTADPGAGGNQTTNEAAYTSYARVAVARTSGGWGVTGSVTNLAALTSFPAATGGSESEWFFGIGTVASTGTGKLLYSGPIGTNQGAFTGADSGDVLTIPGVTGVAVNDPMSFYATPGGTLPGGITTGVIYYVKTISGTAITLSATLGGGTLAITSDGDGLAFKHTPIVVSSGVTPQLTTATTVTEE